MPPVQLKKTTMDPARRTLLRVEELMGRRLVSRLVFIQAHADRVTALYL